MVKKRGKKVKKVVTRKTKASKKTIKSSFQEKEVKYTDVKNSTISKSKDEELNRELKELETGKYYSLRNEKKEVDTSNEKNEIYKPKAKNIFHRKVYDRKRVYDNKVPKWFYMASIFAAFLFTIYISIFATLHFGDISYMNIMIVFLFISMFSFFLISTVFLISEKKKYHAIVPILFLFGIVSIMVYAFKAVDTSDLVRFSIIYTIFVAALSIYVLAIRR